MKSMPGQQKISNFSYCSQRETSIFRRAIPAPAIINIPLEILRIKEEKMERVNHSLAGGINWDSDSKYEADEILKLFPFILSLFHFLPSLASFALSRAVEPRQSCGIEIRRSDIGQRILLSCVILDAIFSVLIAVTRRQCASAGTIRSADIHTAVSNITVPVR